MANEITASVSLKFSKGGKTASVSKQGIQLTMSGTDYTRHTQTIGTSEEALVLGDVGTLGLMVVTNLDATNFVSIRPATGGTNTIKIKAGETQMFRLATAAPFAIADTGAVEIEVLLLED